MELIYLRKSQADNPHESIESVLERHEYQLQEFAAQELGYTIPEEQIFREVISGETIDARVEIKKVLKLIESPDITAVIVIEPQRLGRGDLEDCGRLVNMFRYTDTKIMTPTKTYDLQEKYDRKFFEMELQRGADYLEYYKEIQARGRILSVKRGCYIGSIAPFGYRRICIKDDYGKKCWTLEENPEEAPAIRLAFDLFTNRGYGFAKIAHILEEDGYSPRKSIHWSPSAIKDMLENPVYIGKVRWNRRKTVKNIIDGKLSASRPKNSSESCQIYEGLHRGIIEEETFYAALARRGKNIRVKSKSTVKNPLAGILYCTCGRAMVFQNGRLLCPNQINCSNSSCTYKALESKILTILGRTMKHTTLTVNPFDLVQEKTSLDHFQYLHSRLMALEKKEQNLWEKYSEENMPKEIFKHLIKKVMEEKSQISETLEACKLQPDSLSTRQGSRTASFENTLDAIKNDQISPEEKNIFFKQCIAHIVYSREKSKRLRRKDCPGRPSAGSGWTKPQIRLNIYLNL